MSKKFVPPKLNMGPDFATASSMKAKHKQQVSGSGTPGVPSKRKGKTQKAQIDTIPLTLENLSQYFDWRRGTFDQSPTLFRIASTIWLYLPAIKMEKYSVNFESATENSILEKGGFHAPPTIVTTSPKGDVLIMVENMKKLEEYSEKQYLLILYPYIDSCRFIEDCMVQTASGSHCTYWEIDGVEHLTHIAIDRHGIIYFTTGESVYRIMKAEGDMYLDNYEDIFTPSNDTSHITCLWRQGNDIFLTIQDWDTEENLDVYKLRPPKDKGVSTPDSPTSGTKMSRSQSFGNRGRTRSRSNSGYGSGYGSDYGGSSPRGHGTANDSNDFVTKVRTFSLQFNSRIWQLGTMRFEKKFILAISAAQMGNKPQLLQIGFKKKIKALDLIKSKYVIWPKSVPDQIPHSIYQHKQTKSWFCILPVTNTKYKDGARLYWIQFKMDKTKKKITWQRLVQIPDEAKQGDWLYYDDMRDVLIGFSKSDNDNNQYIFKYLPDMTKYLWIEGATNKGKGGGDDDEKKGDDTSDVPSMQRAIRSRRKSKDKPPKPLLMKRNSSNKNKSQRTGTGSKPSTPSTSLSYGQSASNESNIKPSKAKKESSRANINGVDTNKIKPKPKGKKGKKQPEPKKQQKKDIKKDVKKKDNKLKDNKLKDNKSNKSKDNKTKKKEEEKQQQQQTQKTEDAVKPEKALKIEAKTSNKKDNKKKGNKSPVKRKSSKRTPISTSNGSTPRSPRKTGSSSPRKGKRKPVVTQLEEEDVMD